MATDCLATGQTEDTRCYDNQTEVFEEGKRATSTAGAFDGLGAGAITGGRPTSGLSGSIAQLDAVSASISNPGVGLSTRSIYGNAFTDISEAPNDSYILSLGDARFPTKTGIGSGNPEFSLYPYGSGDFAQPHHSQNASLLLQQQQQRQAQRYYRHHTTAVGQLGAPEPAMQADSGAENAGEYGSHRITQQFQGTADTGIQASTLLPSGSLGDGSFTSANLSASSNAGMRGNANPSNVNSSTTVNGSNNVAMRSGGPAPAQQQCGQIRAPTVEVKLFVGRVPQTIEEAQLKPIFSPYGVVRDVVIIRDRETGTHKGCAFVRMASIADADAAIRDLNNNKVLDPSLGPLQVKYASGETERLGIPPDNAQPGMDQAKLFVGSLPRSASEEDILLAFQRYGKIDEVFIMKDDQNVSKGCAFVRFAYKEEAFNAIACLNNKFIMQGGSRPIEVRFAENKKAQQRQQQQHHQQQQQRMRGVLVPPHVPSAVCTWQQCADPTGRFYYYNTLSRQMQWERPAELDMYPSVQNMSAGAIGAQTHGPPGANVFIFHLPNDWSEHELIKLFLPYGHIVSARIANDRITGRRLGYGFVSYRDIPSAVTAVNHLNQYQAAGKRLKVTIKRGEEQYAAPFMTGLLSSSATVQPAPDDIPVTPPQHSRVAAQRHHFGMQGGAGGPPFLFNSVAAAAAPNPGIMMFSQRARATAAGHPAYQACMPAVTNAGYPSQGR